MNKYRKFFILLISIIGIILTLELGKVYINANFNEYALSSFCSINDFIDCDGVAKTTHSQFFGIPLWCWGLFFYLFVVLMCFVDKLKNYRFLKFLEVFKTPNAYIYSLGLLAFLISISLAFVSIFEIKKICILCFITYFLNLLIAVLARTPHSGIFGDIKTSFKDFFSAIKIKKYLIAFISCSFIAILFLTYSTLSLVFVPQVKKHKSIMQFKNIKGNPYKVSGNVLGDHSAKVVIHEYTDFQCPHCAILNMMLQRAVSELDNIKVIHHNFPIDKHCNPQLKFSPHNNSCMVARYAIAAENQGKYWNLNNDLFNEDKLTQEDIVKFAKKVGIDTKKLIEDANSKETYNKLQKSINDAYNQNIKGTPSLVINSKVYLGIKPYYELKKLLIDLGAIEKK